MIMSLCGQALIQSFGKYLLIGGAISSIIPQWTMLVINDTPVIVGGFVPGAAKERKKVVHVVHLVGGVELCANRFLCSPTIDIVEPKLFPWRGLISNKVTTIHGVLIRIILELNRSGVNENMILISQIASKRFFFLTDSRSNGSKEEEEGYQGSLHILEIGLLVVVEFVSCVSCASVVIVGFLCVASKFKA